MAAQAQDERLGQQIHKRVAASSRIPRVDSAEQAVALAVHHFMVGVVRCQCTGASDQGRIPGFAAPSEEISDAEFVPQAWHVSDDLHTFRYKHAEAPGSTLLLKLLHMGSTCAVHGVVKGNDRTHSAELQLAKVVKQPAEDDSMNWWTPLNTPAGEVALTSALTPLAHALIPALPAKAKLASAESTAAQASQRASAAEAKAVAAAEREQRATAAAQRAEAAARFTGGHNPHPLGEGGLEVGPNHPIFGGRHGIRGGVPAGVDPLTGLPEPLGGVGGGVPHGVPPGARFDPFGPGVPMGPRGPMPDHLQPPSGLDPEFHMMPGLRGPGGRGRGGRGTGGGGLGPFGGGF